MYERNAIVIDRYFSGMFGYDEKSNLENNYSNYCDLVAKLERYQEITSKENNIMIEFERVANEIKEIQGMQETYYKRNLKMQETIRDLFDNLDDKPEMLQRKFNKVEDELNKNNTNIRKNEERFISKIAEFNEKSENRLQCGRERRIIETEYQHSLKETNSNFKELNLKKIDSVKKFLKQTDNDDVKESIKLQILKNGAKEKVPFNTDVINKAIDITTDLENKRAEILVLAYERTGKLLNEIKTDAVRIDKHQKFVRDSESKLKFLNIINEYVILFLDNERMNVLGGQKEHKKLMEDACQNIEKDMVQIKKMYELLLKEISGKATKKVYKDLYTPKYLQGLLEEEKQFERSVSRLNVVGTIINPNYWRLEGIQKIYETFRNLILDVYGKDLSEYEPVVVNEKSNEEIFDWHDELKSRTFKLDESEEVEEEESEDIEEQQDEEEYEDDFDDEIEEDDEEFEMEDDDEIEEDDEEYEEEYDDEEEDDEEEEEEEEDGEEQDEEDDEDFEMSDEDFNFDDDEFVFEEDDGEDDEFEEEEDDEEERDEEEDKEKAIDEILGFYNEDKRKKKK